MSGEVQDANMLATLTSQISQSGGVYYNIQQQFIVITEDKLRGIFHTHVQSLNIRDRWQTPATLFVTLMLVLTTADFHDALKIPKDTWHAVCLIVTALSLLWLISASWKAIFSRRSVDDLIREIKATVISVPPAQQPPLAQNK